jgi:hypothetical protein
VITQGEQAGWFLQFVEACERQRVASVHVFNPYRGIRGDVRRGTLIGLVELLGQRVEFRFGGFATPQRPTDLGPHGFPPRALQQLDPWVTPPFTPWHKHIATLQTLVETFQRTERIRSPIRHGLTRSQDETPPRTRDHVERGLLHVGVALVLELAEKVQRPKHRLPSLHGLKRHGGQQGGQKSPHTAIPVDEFRVIVVIGGPGQRFDLRAGIEHTLTRNLRKCLRTDRSSFNAFVQEDLEGFPELRPRTSRSRKVRIRSFSPVLWAVRTMSLSNRSSKSNASSIAVSSKARAKAGRVASRRSGAMRAFVWACAAAP